MEYKVADCQYADGSVEVEWEGGKMLGYYPNLQAALNAHPEATLACPGCFVEGPDTVGNAIHSLSCEIPGQLETCWYPEENKGELMIVFKSKDNMAYVLADTAEDAHNLVERGWNTDSEFDAEEWEQLSMGTLIFAHRNPYNLKDKTSRNWTGYQWVKDPWNEIPEGEPWIIIDTRLHSEDCFDTTWLYSEEEKDTGTKLAVRRDCPCKVGNAVSGNCPVCSGEGTITKWLDAVLKNGEYRLSEEDVDSAFEILDAYTTIMAAGYTLKRK